MKRRPARRLALVLAAAAAAAWAWRVESSTWDSGPKFSEFTEGGRALVYGVLPEGNPVSFHLPLPSLLAAFCSDQGAWGLWQRLCELLIGCLVLGLGCLLGPQGLFSSALALLLMAAFGGTIHYHHLHSNFTVLFLLVAGLSVWRAQAPSWRRSLGLALALGATLLYRSSLAFFAPIMLACELAFSKTGKRPSLKECLILTLVPYLFLLPWLRMNWIVHHRFIPFENGEANKNIALGALGLVQAVEGDWQLLAEGLPHPGPGASALGWAVKEVCRHPARYLLSFIERVGFAIGLMPVLFLAAFLALILDRDKVESRPLAALALYFVGIHCFMALKPVYFEPLRPLLWILSAGLAVRFWRPQENHLEIPEYRAATRGLQFLLGLLLGLCLYTLHVVNAYADLAARGPEAAQRALDAAIAARPADAWLLSQRGRSRLRQGEIDGAAEDLARAASLSADDAQLALDAAWAQALQGRPGPLLAWRPLAVPTEEARYLDWQAHVFQADVLFRLGHSGEAQRRLMSALENYQAMRQFDGSPSALKGPASEKLYSSEGFMRRSYELIDQRPFPERLAFLKASSSLASASTWLWIEISTLTGQAGDNALAVECLKRAESLTPTDQQLRRIAGLYGQLRQFKRALAILDSLARRAPADAELMTELAQAYMDSGSYGKAAPILEDLAERSAGASPWIARADLALRLGQRGRALGFLARAGKLQAREEDGRRMAELYGALGEYRSALALTQIVTAGPVKDAGLWAQQADYAARLGDRALALSSLARGRDSKPDARELERMGGVYSRLGEYAEARAILKTLARWKRVQAFTQDQGAGIPIR